MKPKWWWSLRYVSVIFTFLIHASASTEHLPETSKLQLLQLYLVAANTMMMRIVKFWVFRILNMCWNFNFHTCQNTKANVQIDKWPWMHRTKTLENCSMTTSESFRKEVAEKLVARQRELWRCFFCQTAIDVLKNGSRRFVDVLFCELEPLEWFPSCWQLIDSWLVMTSNIKTTIFLSSPNAND